MTQPNALWSNEQLARRLSVSLPSGGEMDSHTAYLCRAALAYTSKMTPPPRLDYESMDRCVNRAQALATALDRVVESPGAYAEERMLRGVGENILNSLLCVKK